MKGQLYAAFMERRGRRIFEGAGCLWHDAGSHMIMSIPYHEEMDPPAEEIHRLLLKHGRIGARHLAHPGVGMAGGLYMRRKSPYSMASVDRKAKNRLKRSLERCTVRPVEKDELLRQGLQLNLGTMKRQGRFLREFGEEHLWARFVNAVYDSLGITVTGSFLDGALAAYIVALNEDRWTHLLCQFSARDLLDECYPNNALTFQVTKAAMENSDVDAISYGVAGLVKNEGLHRYKLHHGYEFIPLGYAFVMHPVWGGLLANLVSAWGLHTVRRLYPRVQLLERIQSVVEGARLTKSSPPAVIANEPVQGVPHA
jgi:hypothetical protein